LKRRVLNTVAVFSILLLSLFCVFTNCDSEQRKKQEIAMADGRQKEKGFGETKLRSAPLPEGEKDKKNEEWEPELFLIPEERLGLATLPTQTSDFEFASADEVWIIVKPDEESYKRKRTDLEADESMTIPHRQDKEVGIVEARASITGSIASVEIDQKFQNPFDKQADLSYVFALPRDASINGFVLSVGERRIRGIVREREEADEIYRLARSRGLVASLIEQETTNTLRHRIANIKPREQIEVQLLYFQSLPYNNGSFEFALPLSPEGHFGIVADPSLMEGQPVEGTRKDPKVSLQAMDRNVSVTVEIDAGVEIDGILSPSHDIEVKRHSAQRATVHVRQVLQDSDDEQFLLRYEVAGANARAALFTQRNDLGAFFNLMLIPPRTSVALTRIPLDVVFLLDCSKSMRGKALYKAKELIKRSLETLGHDDTFRIMTFCGTVWSGSDTPIIASKANVGRGASYIESLPPQEGEGMIEGLTRALGSSCRSNSIKIIMVVTDGYIGNDAEVIRRLQTPIGASRVFAFGIGSTVNRHLLESMALAGRGGVIYLGSNDSPEFVAEEFFTRIGTPVLTDISIECENVELLDVFPSLIPDLFVGRPVSIVGRFKGEPIDQMTIRGNGGHTELSIRVAPATASPPAVAHVWARKQISSLTRRLVLGSTDKAEE